MGLIHLILESILHELETSRFCCQCFKCINVTEILRYNVVTNNFFLDQYYVLY